MTRAYNPRMVIEGDGLPLVLVPGINGSGRLFYRQVPRLRTAYRVATYTLRDDAESMGALAEDLGAVVDAVAPPDGRALVVAESFGGAVALTFALEHPERVEALVILNSFPYFSPQARLRMALAGARLVPWAAMRVARQLTARRLHSRHTHHEEITRFIELTSDATRAGYLNRLRLLRTYDVRERLASLKSPTLFLAAEEDRLVPSVAQARLMAARVPHSQMRILAGHGHICLIAPDIDLAGIIHDWRTGAATL